MIFLLKLKGEKRCGRVFCSFFDFDFDLFVEYLD